MLASPCWQKDWWRTPMANPARPYTPETLAERWDCSAQHVRRLISQGQLHAFRVGRLIRIRPEWVEEYECRKSELPHSEESGTPSGTTRKESEGASASTSRRTQRTLVAPSGRRLTLSAN